MAKSSPFTRKFRHWTGSSIVSCRRSGEGNSTSSRFVSSELSITNRATEAIAEYEKALARDPMHADARLNMATALARQGKTDQALRELTRLVEQDPDNAVARTNLGVVLLQLGKIEQARIQLEAALRADPSLEPARQALESIPR